MVNNNTQYIHHLLASYVMRSTPLLQEARTKKGGKSKRNTQMDVNVYGLSVAKLPLNHTYCLWPTRVLLLVDSMQVDLVSTLLSTTILLCF
jgi:hypothetical protein